MSLNSNYMIEKTFSNNHDSLKVQYGIKKRYAYILKILPLYLYNSFFPSRYRYRLYEHTRDEIIIIAYNWSAVEHWF